MQESQVGVDLLSALQARGWSIQRSDSSESLLPAELRERYPRLPSELIEFLQAMDSCANADETAWFLCREDYRRADGETFRWNEFELMCLEDNDADAQKRIRSFWDLHFPIMLCVHSDYDYLAVSLDGPTYGQIVHGCGPDFEETTTVAGSFAEFLAMLKDSALGRRDDYPLSMFL
jgi:SMI1/KNR4 family protein SUKH-1